MFNAFVLWSFARFSIKIKVTYQIVTVLGFCGSIVCQILLHVAKYFALACQVTIIPQVKIVLSNVQTICHDGPPWKILSGSMVPKRSSGHLSPAPCFLICITMFVSYYQSPHSELIKIYVEHSLCCEIECILFPA